MSLFTKSGSRQFTKSSTLIMKTTKKKPSVIVHTFPDIQPINSVEEGIRQGHYTDHYFDITDETVPLKRVAGAKVLYVVCFNSTIEEAELAELLRAEGRQPCRNAPQYLLGLMKKVTEDKMPKEFHNKDLIAAEPDNEASVFCREVGVPCFLCVYRGAARRRLNLIRAGRKLYGHFACIAEDLVS